MRPRLQKSGTFRTVCAHSSNVKFVSRALYADPPGCVKSEVYLGFTWKNHGDPTIQCRKKINVLCLMDCQKTEFN